MQDFNFVVEYIYLYLCFIEVFAQLLKANIKVCLTTRFLIFYLVYFYSYWHPET